MILRRLLHVEWHRGYLLPRVTCKRLPQQGDVKWNGDVLCVLERCQPCGEGFMARQLSPRVERRGGSPARGLRGRVRRGDRATRGALIEAVLAKPSDP